jgi:phosphatidylinositol alpha-mannosyltransferase
VLTEAFAHATTVVASAIPGYTDVVDDDTGVLVPPNDPATLTDAVCRLLGDESRRVALALAGRLRAEALYDWRTIARRLAGIYELHTSLRAVSEVPAP